MGAVVTEVGGGARMREGEGGGVIVASGGGNGVVMSWQ